MKIIVIFLISILILILSKLEIKIIKPKEIYKIEILIVIFKSLKLKVYTKEIEQKLKIQELIANLDFKERGRYKEYKNIIKKVKFKVKKLKFKIEVGSKNIFKTVFLNTLLASNISILLGLIQDKIKDKDLYYEVVPKFNKENVIFKLDCIIQTNIVNIIYIIHLIQKERRKYFDGSTSNRKHNVVCND